MGKHEIRLRRQKMTSGRIEGHKNYYEIMRRHRKSMHNKRLLKSVVYVLFVLGIILVIYFALTKIGRSTNNNSGRKTTIVSLKDKNYGNQKKFPERCLSFTAYAF